MSKIDNLLGYLPTYWKKDSGSNNYNLFYSFVDDMSDVDSQIAELKLNIQISTATGSQLDDIGRLFLLPRLDDETDTDYRARIKAFWPGYSGGGTIASIKQTINRMTGVSVDDITINEYHTGSYIQPLKFEVVVEIPTLGVSVNTVSDMIRATKAAGTYVIPNISSGTTDLYVSTYTDSNNTVTSNFFVGDFSTPDFFIPK